MTTGERIRQLRGDTPQEVIAAKAGVSVRTLRRIELGQTQGNIGTVVAIARALNVSLDDIFEEVSA